MEIDPAFVTYNFILNTIQCLILGGIFAVVINHRRGGGG